jgi:hybrid cluster-associated redox disulfide protein
MRVTEDDTVEDVMRDDPATIRTFLDFEFACIGCPVSSFHSIAFACREHGADVQMFLSALREAAASLGQVASCLPSCGAALSKQE